MFLLSIDMCTRNNTGVLKYQQERISYIFQNVADRFRNEYNFI
jgi:hypothetical protein